jgi:hypothetical protein
MRKTLFILVESNGTLNCYVPEDRYYYQVEDWETFFSSLGVQYIDDFVLFVTA